MCKNITFVFENSYSFVKFYVLRADECVIQYIVGYRLDMVWICVVWVRDKCMEIKRGHKKSRQLQSSVHLIEMLNLVIDFVCLFF